MLDTLKHDYDLQGERLEWLDHAAHISHGTDTAVEIAEVASLIAEGTAAATALQLVAAVLTPIMIGIAILNAADTDKRLAGMQAIGYTLTAWAFGDPIPPFPPVVKGELVVVPRQAGPAQGRTGLERHFRCHRSQSRGAGGQETGPQEKLSAVLAGVGRRRAKETGADADGSARRRASRCRAGFLLGARPGRLSELEPIS